MTDFPGKGIVAAVKTTPETVLDDYERVMQLADFELALDKGVSSIAFPAISTGVYGFPKEAAVAIAVSVMQAFESRFERIVACCFSAADAALYNSALGR